MTRILFIRLRLLGDIIFTIPAIQIFKKYFPLTQIYYLVEENFAEIAQLLPQVEQTIMVPRKMKIKELLAFKNKIKRLKIQTVVDFHSGPKSALLTRLTGAKVRIGYKTPNRNWAYSYLVPRFLNGLPTHSVKSQARLLEYFHIKTSHIPPYPPIHINENALSQRVRQIVKEENKIVIHLGAKKKFRDWGLENFSNLIKKLHQEGANPILIGHSPEEQQRGRLIGSKCEAIDCTGQLTLNETLYIISQSLVYLGADSGPLHLASLTKTPLVALYGPNIPEISGPWRKDKVIIIQKNLDCIPCSQKKCKYDTIKCMKTISVDEVYEAIRSFL